MGHRRRGDVATRTGGTWGAAALATPIRRATSTWCGPAHAPPGDRPRRRWREPVGHRLRGQRRRGPWTVEALDDTGDDVMPRLAVDAGWARARELPARRRPSTRSGTRRTRPAPGRPQVVDAGFNWGRPAFGVDAAGVRHVAVGRTGEEPGVWTGTDAGGHWTLERLTDAGAGRGRRVGVAPDGTASIAYAECLAADGTPLADPAVRVTTGKPGAWTTTRIADDTGDASPSIARDAAGHLHSRSAPTRAASTGSTTRPTPPGAWVVTPATPGAAGQATSTRRSRSTRPGRSHVAFERSTETPLPYGTVSIDYATNATGAWVASTIASGPEYRFDPSIALDPSGRPRVAYWLDNDDGALGTAGGVRLATLNGPTWSTATTSARRSTPPVDRHRRRRPQPRPLRPPDAVLDLRRPALPVRAGPALLVGHAGLRGRSPGDGQRRRHLPGRRPRADGSISGVVRRRRLAARRHPPRPALPTASAPAAHLSGAGTTLPRARHVIVASPGARRHRVIGCSRASTAARMRPSAPSRARRPAP